jgi:hypothetical protein
VVALNSLYYLLNDDSFSGFEVPFLLRLLRSCKVLFVDKVSTNLISYFIGSKICLNIERVNDVIFKISAMDNVEIV